MIFLQKKRYKKYKGMTITGFSSPPLTSKSIIPKGRIVGYGSNQLIVSCENVKGFPKENIKLFHWIDEIEQLANKNGFWFVSIKEVKDSINEELKK